MSDSQPVPGERIPRGAYERRLRALQVELVAMQDWVINTGYRLVVLFEGRDTAGKGGTIQRITQTLRPRWCRTVALAAPTERERTQWYFQRYVEHLPAAGEIVLFDRSWYNRAGVERVMGFCTPAEHRQFLLQAPVFETMLIESGIRVVKYWLSISAEGQLQRFKDRAKDPAKRWKLSDMDLAARTHWYDYSRAKDEMFAHTDTPISPWYVVEADDKRAARINLITHLLGQVPYRGDRPKPLKLPPLQADDGYHRPPMAAYRHVPDIADRLR
ncbi:MAG: polyphosphate kinase [Mycobacteriales bacterium]|jgi:polyphosphate kinase 2